MDAAVDWVKRHRAELLAGSVVVIAGVAFAVAFSGGSVIILAPILLVASSDAPSAFDFEESIP
ncbi:hypothetical protein BO221_36080 [Archangium sp. Cb G35]|nr:hypothetical protein BO221_36080 [Archangium sp. Cb G35]